VAQHSPSVAKRQETGPSKNGLIGGLIFTAVGTALFLLGGWSAKLGFETTQWPQVPATIVKWNISVSERSHSHKQDALFQNRRESLYLDTAYVYQVGGREYTAEGLQRGTLGSGKLAPVRKLWGTLNKGSQVKVAINPDDPSEAYLVPGISGLAYLIGGVGLAVNLIGMMMFASYRNGRKRYHARTKARTGR
jgi:Protein of unknown function (DUF3592)